MCSSQTAEPTITHPSIPPYPSSQLSSSCLVLSLSLARTVFQLRVIFSPSSLPLSTSPTSRIKGEPFHKFLGKRRVKLSLMVRDATLGVSLDIRRCNKTLPTPENDIWGPGGGNVRTDVSCFYSFFLFSSLLLFNALQRYMKSSFSTTWTLFVSNRFATSWTQLRMNFLPSR